ncbi:MAG TPA: AraC family transcriptional regulator [Planctomycetota bacterium]|nr:AraC family transcriptional regulator [Planctomycetota bacterium]
MSAADEFWRMAEASLRFEYHAGAVTHLEGSHTTGWRTMPDMVTAQIPIGHAMIEFDRVARTPLKTGECLCIAPGVRHRITMMSQEEISRWSHFNFFVLGSLNLASLLVPPQTIPGKAAEKIGDLNEALASVAQQPPSLRRMAALHAMGFSLLQILVECSESTVADIERLQATQRLAGVLDLIHRELDGDLDQERLARVAHLSVSRFRAVFHATLGTSPRDYIGGLRLQRAQQLLISTDLPVNAIAAQTGHGDAFHFSRIFKKKCGVSPSEYRERARVNVVM